MIIEQVDETETGEADSGIVYRTAASEKGKNDEQGCRYHVPVQTRGYVERDERGIALIYEALESGDR